MAHGASAQRLTAPAAASRTPRRALPALIFALIFALLASIAPGFTHTTGKVDGRDARLVSILPGDPVIELAALEELSIRVLNADAAVVTSQHHREAHDAGAPGADDGAGDWRMDARAGCVEAESPKTLNPALSSGETMKVSASERIMVSPPVRPPACPKAREGSLRPGDLKARLLHEAEPYGAVWPYLPVAFLGLRGLTGWRAPPPPRTAPGSRPRLPPAGCSPPHYG